MQTVLTALQLISMITGLGAGTLALVTSRRQPAAKARQLRIQSVFMFGLAALMASLLFL